MLSVTGLPVDKNNLIKIIRVSEKLCYHRLQMVRFVEL